MIKRAFLISDLHLGCHSNSNEWVEIIKDYFDNFFIPLVKKEYKDGDVLIICGDTFNSRQSIDLVVLKASIEIFTKLSKLFNNGIYLIAGNHDIYGKHNNEVTSISMLSLIKNIHVVTETLYLNAINNNKLLLMAWNETMSDELEIINNTDADYLFCHTTIMGLKYNKYTMTQEGNSIKDFKKFKFVFSGHIHLNQKKDNFIMMGCPYQITRADEDNQKGVFLLDFEKDDYLFFENNYSPKFVSLNFQYLINEGAEKIDNMVSNNFLNIIVNENDVDDFNKSELLNNITEYRKVEVNMVSENDNDVINDIEINSDLNFNVVNIISAYIDKLETNVDKDKLKKAIQKLYQQLNLGSE